jgi:hypothetical protein
MPTPTQNVIAEKWEWNQPFTMNGKSNVALTFKQKEEILSVLSPVSSRT